MKIVLLQNQHQRMKHANYIIVISVILVALLGMPSSVNALQTGVASGQLDAGGGALGLTNDDPRIFIATIIQASLGVLGVVFAGLIVLAGYWFLIARGREDYIENARKTMLRAVVGMLLVLASYSITTLVKNSVEELGNATGDSRGVGQGGIDVHGGACCMVCDRSDGQNVCNFDTFNSSNREYVKDIYQVPVTPDRCGALEVVPECEAAGDNCVIKEVTDPQCNLARPVPSGVYDED